MQRLTSRARRRLEGERGASAVVLALLLVPMLGFAAIAVDIGALYAERARLQVAADAAAIAVAQDCSRGNCGDMLATAQEAVRLGVNSVKLHNLYAVKNTELADQVERGEVQLISRDDYIRTLVDILERLPPHIVVERISGDAPADYFIGPAWCLDKPAVKLALEQELQRRDTWQGKLARQDAC